MNSYSLTILAFVLSTSSVSAAFTTPAKSLQQWLYHEIPSTSQPPNPKVLLLGGGPGFSSWNLETIQNFVAKEGFDTYLMDMQGIGENKKPMPNPILPSWINQVHQLKQEISPQQPIVLIGHSWGALMAMLYQREHPEAVQKLILLNPVDPEKKAMQHLHEDIHAANQGDMSWDNEAAWNNDYDDSPEALAALTQRQIEQVLPTYFYDRRLGNRYAKQFSATDFSIQLNVDAWKEYDAAPIQYSTLNKRLQKYQTPVYFLECRQDFLMPYNLNAMQAKMTFKQTVILDQCGHFPWIEQTPDFHQSLSKFLKDIAS